MSEAVLEIPPASEHVRLARLVAASAARHAGVGDEDVLDDIRLAVAEAVSRAIIRHADAGLDRPVRVSFEEAPGCFRVRVADAVGVDDPGSDHGLALAVIQGLVAAARIESATDGGEIVWLEWVF